MSIRPKQLTRIGMFYLKEAVLDALYLYTLKSRMKFKYPTHWSSEYVEELKKIHHETTLAPMTAGQVRVALFWPGSPEIYVDLCEAILELLINENKVVKMKCPDWELASDEVHEYILTSMGFQERKESMGDE